ncbi:glutathione peroxidase [Sphingomonas jatrophae]|uniref:Glutathione peroxidase n=1 Tax=Sphingomonas jatrophae TaxID=1166337 RepID=A0A1I6K114_9SPHN|nr:glutathione peroxidase [Sphingomonas jatrophae]SFR84945.1 glutathione peroxidase [Sphingomonas jatrophae]
MTAIQDIPVNTIDGKPAKLADWDGQVALVVNVASKCGLTPQYDALEKLYRQYRDRGFVVLGFPANDFGAQEPGTDADIAEFCSTTFDVDFPMFSKIAVTGENTHPLYRALIAEHPQVDGPADEFREKLKGYGMEPNPAPGILWNFEKFLIGRDGKVAARFAPSLAPDDAKVVEAIEAALG